MYMLDIRYSLIQVRYGQYRLYFTVPFCFLLLHVLFKVAPRSNSYFSKYGAEAYVIFCTSENAIGIFLFFSKFF